MNYRDYFPAGTKDIPLGGLFPAHWTDDEKYLYYTFSIAYDGVGTCFYGFGDQGLYRISLADGKIATILPYTPAVLGYEIAFSPTGRRLAYQGNGNPVILDLQTGKEITMNIKGNTVGNFTWSPDGKELAFGACQVHKDGNDYAVTWSAIKIYSVQSQTSRTILEVEKDFLTIDGWSDDNVIAAERKDFKNLPTYLYIDASSGSFVTATPKP